MTSKYTTKIDLKKRKSNLKNISRFAKRNSRNYLIAGSSNNNSRNPFAKMSKERKQKIKRVAGVIFAIMFVVFLGVFLRLLWYVQTITEDLPSPDAPFGKRNEASVIMAGSNEGDSDKKEELYKLFGDENLDFVSISEVPEHVKWAVLAAEDIDFYEHPGFDAGGLIAAVLYECCKIGSPRGGSTITQQILKLTVIGSERSVERKIKELILALQVERLYEKDQILEMYLNVSNYGSNIYGIKTAAKFYFGKENLNDLTLAEASILARIPQGPLYNSPTLAPDPEEGKKTAKENQGYVLDQMEKNLDKINDHIESNDNIILQEEIDAAREAEIVYKEPRIDIKAPHFVFYIRQLLTNSPYNNGQPFELSDLETGGYKIYTTLDMNLQKIAQEEVLNGVNQNAKPYGGNNGAVIITKPDTGDILAMVGSKDYFAPSEGKLFDGKVNVTNTLQSMGSSMKPAGYEKAFELGISSPGSYLPDVEIQIGSYKPRNWNGAFKGPDAGATAREQLRESRNIPAVILVDAMGVNSYIETLTKWGYNSIASNPGGYGPSLILGGGDVTMVEHAQGYGVLSNGGQLVKLDPIVKITKVDPETGEEVDVYNKEVKKEPVADQRAVYMINHILNYKNNGPGANIDGRDHSGKTGTTELSKDTIYAGYTPDFVVIGWNGNNDNTSMSSIAFGENVTKPWVVNLTKRIAPFFPEKSPFPRPGGLVSGNACSNAENANNNNQDGGIQCAEIGGDFLIEGKTPPSYIYTKSFRVCRDQQDKLAREIDESMGFAQDKNIKVYKMASPGLQPFLDAAVSRANLIPTEYCDIARSPNGNNPFATISATVNSINDVDVTVNGYSIQGVVTTIELFFLNPSAGGTQVTSVNNQTSLTASVDIGSYGYTENAFYPICARVYDNTGAVGVSCANVKVGGANGGVPVNGPGTVPVNTPGAFSYFGETSGFDFTGGQLWVLNSSYQVIQRINVTATSATWTPTATGNYSVYFVLNTANGIVVQGTSKNVTVN